MALKDSTGRPAAADDDVDLARLVAVVWRYLPVIVVMTAACGAFVLVGHLRAPASYQATARLLVSAPKTGATNEIANALTVSVVRDSDVVTLRALASNQAIAARMVAEFGLARPPHSLTPLAFLDQGVDVETVPDSNVIELRVRLRDPQLAARVANRFAAEAVDLARRLDDEQAAAAQEVIGKQVSQSRDRLERAEAQLLDFRKRSGDRAAADLSPLQVEYDAAKALFVDATTRYEQARVHVASRSAQLQILDPALPPDVPISRHTVRDTGLAVMAAGLLSALGVLLVDWIGRARREGAAGPKPPSVVSAGN